MSYIDFTTEYFSSISTMFLSLSLYEERSSSHYFCQHCEQLASTTMAKHDEGERRITIKAIDRGAEQKRPREMYEIGRQESDGGGERSGHTQQIECIDAHSLTHSHLSHLHSTNIRLPLTLPTLLPITTTTTAPKSTTATNPPHLPVPTHSSSTNAVRPLSLHSSLPQTPPPNSTHSPNQTRHTSNVHNLHPNLHLHPHHDLAPLPARRPL